MTKFQKAVADLVEKGYLDFYIAVKIRKEFDQKYSVSEIAKEINIQNASQREEWEEEVFIIVSDLGVGEEIPANVIMKRRSEVLAQAWNLRLTSMDTAKILIIKDATNCK